MLKYTTFMSRENADSAELFFSGAILDIVLDGKTKTKKIIFRGRYKYRSNYNKNKL